jgi:DNA invertase Pin-like site-specific DNA recombinase
MNNKANKAIAYIRVSTEEQATEGVSIEAQEQAIRAYCTLRSLELVDLVIDAGVSAGKALSKREGGNRVLQAVQKGEVDSVVSYKLDRLFRDCSDCLDVTRIWDKSGTSLHLLDLGGQAVDTSSAMGRFFLTVMAGAAELERNQIRERTSAAMQHKIQKGEYTGGKVPYGFNLAADGKTLERDQNEQEIRDLVQSLRNKGLSLRKIAQELQDRGFKTRTGKNWHPQSIANIAA